MLAGQVLGIKSVKSDAGFHMMKIYEDDDDPTIGGGGDCSLLMCAYVIETEAFGFLWCGVLLVARLDELTFVPC